MNQRDESRVSLSSHCASRRHARHSPEPERRWLPWRRSTARPGGCTSRTSNQGQSLAGFSTDRGHQGSDSFVVTLDPCDWDLDGTCDLVAGTVWYNTRLINGHFPGAATPFWLRNTGSGDESVFERPRLITEADGTPINLGHHKCSVWCHDLDGDGAPDLVSSFCVAL